MASLRPATWRIAADLGQSVTSTASQLRGTHQPCRQPLRHGRVFVFGVPGLFGVVLCTA